jgi:Na+-translocating ferredoxin:NAD+ oxidoreductase RnfD subunit
MMRFAIAVLKRLLVSVAIVVSIIAFGSLYGYVFGPSEIAYAGAILLVAWPWTLPQVFIVVSVVWFLVQRIRSLHHHRGHPAT